MEDCAATPQIHLNMRTKEVISINEYMTSETRLPAYLPYPRFLLAFDLTLTAKLVYALLLDRTTLSQKNGWVDEAGHIYVLFTLKSMAEAINRSTMSVKKALNELQAAELIERMHHGFSMPNRIFVKLPTCGKITVPTVERKLSIMGKENCPSSGKKSFLAMERKLSPNNLSKNNLSNIDLRGASATEAPIPYGQYENVLLTEEELATLQTELPDQWQHYIERLSEYMASTGKRYKNYLATIRRWAADDAKKNTPKRGIPDYTCKEGESL